MEIFLSFEDFTDFNFDFTDALLTTGQGFFLQDLDAALEALFAILL